MEEIIDTKKSEIEKAFYFWATKDGIPKDLVDSESKEAANTFLQYLEEAKNCE